MYIDYSNLWKLLVDNLTNTAGTAKGSFYKFCESMEMIIFTVSEDILMGWLAKPCAKTMQSCFYRDCRKP